jgi:DNA topoisomerase-3
VIHDLSTRRERKQPPQLYDLTELQRDMNRRYGMSAALTLKTAQTLYEKKLISYPRTDSRYLTSDLKNEIPKILQRLSDQKTVEIDRLDLKALAFSRRIVNNQKVNDHHAIIPTGSKPKSMSPWDSKVYDAIVVRFIAAFYPPCVSDITTVRAKANQVPFQARGTLVIDPGWTILYPRSPASKSDQSKQPDEDQSLPPFQSGERGPHQPFIRQGETKPPKHFTENTLLGVMETAGKLVDDEELKEALKDRGLGTPATRAATIETLLKRDYIERSKKTLKATNLGRYLIALVQDKQLKSAELTGLWEAKLKAIEAGHLDSRRFMQDIVEFTEQLIKQPDDHAVDVKKIGDCPRCQREIIEGQRGFGCSGWRDGCKFVIWKKQREHQFEVGQIRELLQLGRLIDCSSTGKDQESLVVLTPTGAVVEVPVPTAEGRRYGKKQWKNQSDKTRAKSARKPTHKQTSAVLAACPMCDGSVIEQKLSYSCNKWRDGCKFVIWKNISGKRIGLRTAKSLLEKGRSSVLKGFKSKAGNRFDARLVLDQGVVRLDFDDSKLR